MLKDKTKLPAPGVVVAWKLGILEVISAISSIIDLAMWMKRNSSEVTGWKSGSVL